MPIPTADRDRRISLLLKGKHWDPLYIYAEANNLRPHQAAAELLLAAISQFPNDSVYVIAAQNARNAAMRHFNIEVAVAINRIYREWCESVMVNGGITAEDLDAAILRDQQRSHEGEGGE